MKQVTYVASSGSNVYSNSGVTITPSQPVQIDDDSVTDIAAMHSGAIVVEFTPQISSIHSLIGISNSTTAILIFIFMLVEGCWGMRSGGRTAEIL